MHGLIYQEAVEKAAYEPGRDIRFAIDAASSEMYQPDKKAYYFAGESKMRGEEIYRTGEEMVQYYQNLCDKFPIISLEDGLDENDWDGWKLLTSRLGNRIQLVG